MQKSIFISGGAVGIGRQVALRFRREGWIVGVYDRDEKALAALREEHPEIVTGRLDVTDAGQWEAALADFTSRTGGRLDVLDNNAGIIGDGDIVEQDPALIAAQNNVNCTGAVLGARAAHRYLKATRGSHLVNMGSASAIYGQPHITPYSASKFYITGLTEALDLEWRGDGIRVVGLMPLWVKTKLADVEAASTRRLGVRITPEQVAETVWKAVNPRNAIERRRLFYSVSAPDLALRYLRRIAPQPLARLVNMFAAG
ncbi:SDR family oxidoreductase [Corynebacterium mastitidis]|uniref:Short-chain dehydrogenase n=1 Tax=Corynebacterium mastitidis TaxID=161890 RepID=A0A2N0X684_9CORY|nr:SDR family oxidoreductase [Corynebacterium mastitidis]MCH6196453.1 SDR family oxidoreductase [Corynebacterium mastitidis]PKF68201.1 short-chain dehydrogenase [Corynebacterium mastitidis]